MGKGRGVSSEYWKRFWSNHGRKSIGAPAQSQVLRTLNKLPVADETFDRIVGQIEETLRLGPQEDLLDLCCGNGAITVRLASRCRSALGVDVSQHLLDQVDRATAPNLALRAEDVAKVHIEKNQFSRILVYAGIQYFSEDQIVALILSLHTALRPSGLLLLGDVPDAQRIWSFFDTPERERAYFDSVCADKPIIGTWIDPGWLTRLGAYAGFSEASVIPQPRDFPYAHYRYDVLMRKS